MVFQEILEMLEKRQYAEIDKEKLFEFYKDMANVYMGLQYGDKAPQDFKELREWLIDRVEGDFKYQRTGYVNDHFCVGAMWGAIMYAILSS